MKKPLFLLGMLFFCLALPVSSQQVEDGLTIHVVQRGENLFRIGLQYGVTIDELAQINSLANINDLEVGQRLLVPQGNITQPERPLTHVVQPGETLRTIGELYDLSVEILAAYNRLDNPNTIYVGQILQLSDTQGSQPVIEAAPESMDVSQQERLIHVVQSGETLFRIATNYSLTVNDLVKVNTIDDPTRIYVGQELYIPGYEPIPLATDLPLPFANISTFPQTFVEGRTVRVRVTTTVAAQVRGSFLGRDIQAGTENNGLQHTILQGIPLFTEPGIYPFQLQVTDVTSGNITSYAFNVEVVAGPYGRETIQLLEDRGDLLNPTVEDAEMELMQRVMAPFTEPRYFSGSMGLPAAATVISPFGTRRSYNGGDYDRFHSGTDFAGAPGTPIMATAPGRVVLADTLNVRGMATVIDHGWGVYTGYWHQSQQYVQVGDMVTTGQVIGTIGSTGRVTGAHLHWELWTSGVPVDPMQWVRQPFS